MIYKDKPNEFNPKFEVVSCFFEFDGQLLFLHRPIHKSQGGKWGVPGGKIDAGESMNQAMIREIKEETGVVLDDSEIKYLETVYVRYDTHDFVYHMFKKIFDEKPNIVLRDEEHDNFEWFLISDSLKIDLIEDMKPCIEIVYGL